MLSLVKLLLAGVASSGGSGAVRSTVNVFVLPGAETLPAGSVAMAFAL